jgi:hypothetical protein
MIRIGFDPILEVERQHKELWKQAEYERMLKEARETSQYKAIAGSRFLALIGKGMATVGLRLAERYGNGSSVFTDFVSKNPDLCG